MELILESQLHKASPVSQPAMHMVADFRSLPRNVAREWCGINGEQNWRRIVFFGCDLATEIAGGVVKFVGLN
jgi:hypothetical protein